MFIFEQIPHVLRMFSMTKLAKGFSHVHILTTWFVIEAKGSPSALKFEGTALNFSSVSFMLHFVTTENATTRQGSEPYSNIYRTGGCIYFG